MFCCVSLLHIRSHGVLRRTQCHQHCSARLWEDRRQLPESYTCCGSVRHGEQKAEKHTEVREAARSQSPAPCVVLVSKPCLCWGTLVSLRHPADHPPDLLVTHHLVPRGIAARWCPRPVPRREACRAAPCRAVPRRHEPCGAAERGRCSVRARDGRRALRAALRAALRSAPPALRGR